MRVMVTVEWENRASTWSGKWDQKPCHSTSTLTLIGFNAIASPTDFLRVKAASAEEGNRPATYSYHTKIVAHSPSEGTLFSTSKNKSILSLSISRPNHVLPPFPHAPQRSVHIQHPHLFDDSSLTTGASDSSRSPGHRPRAHRNCQGHPDYQVCGRFELRTQGQQADLLVPRCLVCA